MEENKITRREAVERVGALGAAGVLMSTSSVSEAALNLGGNDDCRDAQLMSFQDWSKFVGDDFTVTAEAYSECGDLGQLSIKLIDVDDLSHDSDQYRPAGMRQSAYALLFQAPLETNLLSRTYTVEHVALGALCLHLQEVCKGCSPGEVLDNKGNGQFYEVVFN